MLQAQHRPIYFLPVVNYGYEKLLKLMEGNIEVAKEHLTSRPLTKGNFIAYYALGDISWKFYSK
jgi:hypothetical protein